MPLKKNKILQRKHLYAARNAQQAKTEVSRIICDTVIQQPIYQQAQTVMWYCHCRSEVRTLNTLKAQLSTEERIVIPYCSVDKDGIKHLGLWLLEDLTELCPGTWNILEPPVSRRKETGKQVAVDQLDVIIVPGVGFDKNGGRLGNGAGYYDRLMQTLKPHTVLIGVAYEAQLLEQVEMQAHDVFLDLVITEKAVYIGNGRH